MMIMFQFAQSGVPSRHEKQTPNLFIENYFNSHILLFEYGRIIYASGWPVSFFVDQLK